MEQQGTITWFKISESLPPKDEKVKTSIGTPSVEVIITDDKAKHVFQTQYMYFGDNSGQWVGYNLILFTPVYWAFINPPKK